MEAIVLAGGFGTRLRAVVPDLPKPMAPVAGRPFLEILLTTLAAKGFTRVILSLGFMADKVVSHFGREFRSMELVYEIETTPLNTGGAVRAAIGHCRSDHVYVFNGDTYLDLEVAELERQWQATKEMQIVVRAVEDTARFGRVDLSHGHIVAFREKGAAGPGLINAGCYVLPAAALDAFALGQPFSLETEFLIPAVQTTAVGSFVTQGVFIDIGVPEDYDMAQSMLAEI